MANSVPLGQSGTGAAVILNGGQATNTFLHNLEGIKQQKALQQKQQALMAQKQAEDLASAYRDNALKARTGTLYADQLSKIEGDYVNTGMQAAKQGQNLYDPNNPNAQAYAEQRRNIEGLREYAKRNEGIYNEAIKNAKDYDPEDLQALNNFVKGDINEQYKSGAVPPTLQPRFDVDKVLTGVRANTVFDKRVVGSNTVDKTVIDRPSTEKAIISNIAANQGGERFLNRLTGGMPIKELQTLPKTKEEIRKGIELDFDGNPELQQVAAQNGLVKGTKRYDNWLENQADELYAKKTKFDDFMNNAVSKVSAGVQVGQRVTPTLSEALKYRMSKDAEKENNSSSQPIDITIPFGVGGKENVKLNGYVGFTSPAKNFAGSEYIDLRTGKPAGKLSSSSDYEIVGVGNAPFVNKGSLKGSISQPNYADNNPNDIQEKPVIHVQQKTTNGKKKDYFIPYDRLPENVKQSKSFREATANFVPATQNKQPTGKSYSTKYGDFTEEQLKSTYGDAWKKAYEKIKK